MGRRPAGQLIAAQGRDHFRRLWISDGALAADLLVSDTVVRSFQHFSDKTGWEEPHQADILDPELNPPTSVPLAELHLDRLPQWEKHLLPKEDALTFHVDEVGRLRLWTGGEEENGGLLLDGTGRVAELSDDVAADVVRAIAEIVAGYGNQAQTVGGFNDFVHVDLNAPGATMGMRVIRYPKYRTVGLGHRRPVRAGHDLRPVVGRSDPGARPPQEDPGQGQARRSGLGLADLPATRRWRTDSVVRHRRRRA